MIGSLVLMHDDQFNTNHVRRYRFWYRQTKRGPGKRNWNKRMRVYKPKFACNDYSFKRPKIRSGIKNKWRK